MNLPQRGWDIGRLVTGHLMPSADPIRICDISFGGFAMETAFPVRVGADLDFRFTSTNGSAFDLRARVVHTRRLVALNGDISFVTGLEFVHQKTWSAAETNGVLVERINWILSFYADDPDAARNRTSLDHA